MQADLTLGEHLRRLRRKKKLALQDVAREARLSVSHLSRLENDNAVPTAETVVKVHKVLGGSLAQMLELADCLPREILDRYIRRVDDAAPVLKRSSAGRVDEPLFSHAFVEDMDPAIRRALAAQFGLSDRDVAGLMTALRRLARMDPQEREQIIAVLQMATRGTES
jgi:transcriptional regulator with XRE-family HTH domain